MANDPASPAAARGGMSLVLMAVAVLSIAALFGWLAMQTKDQGATTVAEADTTAEAEEIAGPPAEAVSDTAFEQNMRTYRGRDVRLTAKVSAGLSPQTFWLELPTGQPFLVKLDSAMVARGATPPTGGRVAVTGAVRAKDAALVGQWLQQGVLQNEDQRMQAEFGGTYIEARQVRPAR
jgi:cytochrome c-type biogenesis protein CcmH/NrfG